MGEGREARRLRGADAVVVVALLLFMVGWVVALTWNIESEDTEDWGAGEAFGALVVVGGPAVWAGGLVRRIVDHGTPDDIERWQER